MWVIFLLCINYIISDTIKYNDIKKELILKQKNELENLDLKN